MKGLKNMVIDPRAYDDLLSDVVPQVRWIDTAIDKLVEPMFNTKSTAYSGDGDQFRSIREMARRNFPEEYSNNEWYAMARVVGILVDKHHVALAKDPGVYESRDRAIDCVVYELFRLRFILLGNELESKRTMGRVNVVNTGNIACQGEHNEHPKCNCQGNSRKLSFDDLAD